MKKEFLEGLKLDEGTVAAILAESEKEEAESAKKIADYDDVKKQLENANATIEKFSDYEQTKAEVEKYKADYQKLKDESAAKITGLERSAKISEFLTGKKFANKITAEAVKSKLSDMLVDTANAGKSVKELFESLIKDDENILQKQNDIKTLSILVVKQIEFFCSFLPTNCLQNRIVVLRINERFDFFCTVNNVASKFSSIQ